MKRSRTDSGSNVGIAVGLIDAMLSITRVLAPMLQDHEEWMVGAVNEALTDLGQDDNLNSILSRCPVFRMSADDAVLYERVALLRLPSRTPEQDARLEELHALVQAMPNQCKNERDSFDDMLWGMAKDSPETVVKLLNARSIKTAPAPTGKAGE